MTEPQPGAGPTGGTPAMGLAPKEAGAGRSQSLADPARISAMCRGAGRWQ